MKEYITGIQHVGVPTKDMEATLDFYIRLGFSVAFETVNEANGAKVVFLKQKNLVIEAYEETNVKMVTGAIDHVAIDVTDIEKVYEEICNMGLNTLQDEINFLPFWEKGVRFFSITGPNQERIEFNQVVKD